MQNLVIFFLKNKASQQLQKQFLKLETEQNQIKEKWVWKCFCPTEGSYRKLNTILATERIKISNKYIHKGNCHKFSQHKATHSPRSDQPLFKSAEALNLEALTQSSPRESPDPQEGRISRVWEAPSFARRAWNITNLILSALSITLSQPAGNEENAASSLSGRAIAASPG